ncbi:STAS domain-containing protein [Muricoccus radiodurans]|uniref:STAS domain-containing protein n=1 Tax=Muricoccus radiodurans TaxID=2231721 RepID=UPI003CF08E87
MRFDLTETDTDTLRIALEGRLDASGAALIELPFTATVSGAEKHVILDLSAVPFVASLGIRLLLSAARVAQRRGKRVVIVGAGPQPREVFETVALDTLIPVVADETAARSLLAA